MQEEKIDRRVRKTKKILLDSLTKLLSEKKLNNITVKELTELADVNRSTFYLYYKDIFDMIEQIEKEMLVDFAKALEQLKKENNYYTNLLIFFTNIIEYVQNNAEMCKILFGPDGDSSFIEKFKNVIIQTKPSYDESVPRIQVHYLVPFIITGCIGVIQQWLKDDMNIPPKEMATIIMEMIPTKFITL